MIMKRDETNTASKETKTACAELQRGKSTRCLDYPATYIGWAQMEHIAPEPFSAATKRNANKCVFKIICLIRLWPLAYLVCAQTYTIGTQKKVNDVICSHICVTILGPATTTFAQ